MFAKNLISCSIWWFTTFLTTSLELILAEIIVFLSKRLLWPVTSQRYINISYIHFSYQFSKDAQMIFLFSRQFQIQNIIIRKLCFSNTNLLVPIWFHRTSPFLEQIVWCFHFPWPLASKSCLMRFCLMIRGLLRATHKGRNTRNTIKSD